MEDGNSTSSLIIIPYKIYRSFVESHRHYVFLYGNDYLNKGCFGQAWFVANEPNSFRIPTLYKYCASPKFFQDGQYDHWITFIKEELAKIPLDGRPIIPLPKIGRGGSRLQEFGPKLLKFIEEEINKIKYPNIEIDYYGTKTNRY